MAGKNSLTWRHALIALAVVGGGIYLLRGRQPTPAEPLPTTSADPGAATAKPCALRFPSAPTTRVLLFPSEAGLNEYLKAAAAADIAASRNARDANNAIVVQPGTRCELVEKNSDKAKVRILEGDSRDQVAWTTLETTGM